MNIAFVTSAFRKAKKESKAITTFLLASKLIQHGHKVTIITEKTGNYPSFEKIDNLPVHRPYGNGPKFYNQIIAPALGVRKIQKDKKIKFDVVHGFSAAPILALRTIIAQKLFAKRSKTIHTIKSYSRYQTGFARILNMVDTITVPTEVMKQKLISQGVNKNKIKKVHSFIDTKKWRPMNKAALKQKHKLPKRVLLYYGSVFEKKGVNNLLEAFSGVLKTHPNALLILALRDRLTEKYQKIVEKHDLNKNIKVITENINMVEYVNLADVVVLPYIDLIGTEGNPSCILEAVACKTPVVTTDQPELKEVFGDSELLYAKPSNPESLAQEINKVLKNPKSASIKSNKAHKKIKNFDVEKITKQFIKLYKS
jgi:glycosyltransferase involved in cell wall biosynthesis